MDVASGHCWRCENEITKEVKCAQCSVAKNCSDTCCHRDQYRHKPECEEWRPKRCSNPRCTSGSSQSLKECTSCNDASYCSKECQKAHWKDHKRQCRQRAQEIRDKGAAFRSYFQQQCGVPFAVPYYFGNALAIDMLNLQANECREKLEPGDKDPLKRTYSVLSTGSGNLRNWIHTAASLPDEFAGKLHTVLNDFDPFVQARNVLQLYMMVMHQEKTDIAASVTNIWYSLKLTEHDYNLIVECLTALQNLTAEELVKVTQGVILLTEAEMSPMREVWQSWLNLECREGQPGYIDLRAQRREVFMKSPSAAEGIAVYKREIPSELVPSYDAFLENGNFQSQSSKSRDDLLQYDNPTLTGYKFSYGRNEIEKILKIFESPKKVKFVYCISDDLSPFGSWDYLKVKKHYYNKSMTGMFHRYITDQIQRVIRCLKAGLLSVSFIIWNCLELPARLNSESCQFDRIFTSNIADYSGTRPLLKGMKPYLNGDNKYSVIVTQYWNWYGLFPYAKVDGPQSAGASRTKVLIECSIAAVKDTHIDSLGEAPLSNPIFMNMECKKAMKFGPFFLQEYFNYSVYFVSYLRAEFLALKESPGDSSKDEFQDVVHMQSLLEHMGVKGAEAAIPSAATAGDKATTGPPPTFQDVKYTEGLQLRDFRRGELNKVVPFRYRRNARRVNLLRGMDRMLEWYIP